MTRIQKMLTLFANHPNKYIKMARTTHRLIQTTEARIKDVKDTQTASTVEDLCARLERSRRKDSRTLTTIKNLKNTIAGLGRGRRGKVKMA